MRIALAEQHAAPAWDETRRSFSIWQRSRLDHERDAQPTTWKRNRARVRETRLQQSCHEFGGTFARTGWCDSGRSRFASVSLNNFAAFRILHAISTSKRGREIGEEIFVLPSGFAFIESSLLSRERLTLTTLQRLNEAYPDHSFHSLVGWHLRTVGAEAV